MTLPCLTPRTLIAPLVTIALPTGLRFRSFFHLCFTAVLSIYKSRYESPLSGTARLFSLSYRPPKRPVTLFFPFQRQCLYRDVISPCIFPFPTSTPLPLCAYFYHSFRRGTMAFFQYEYSSVFTSRRSFISLTLKSPASPFLVPSRGPFKKENISSLRRVLFLWCARDSESPSLPVPSATLSGVS